MNIEEKIKEINVSEKSVEFCIDWLAQKDNHVLESNNLSDLVRYLLLEVNSLKQQLNQTYFRIKGSDLISVMGRKIDPDKLKTIDYDSSKIL